MGYIGERDGHSGIWYGIELTVGEGRNDGTEHGSRYFQCDADRDIFVRFKSIKFKLGNPKCADSMSIHSDSDSNAVHTAKCSSNSDKIRSTKSPNTPNTPNTPRSPNTPNSPHSPSPRMVSRPYRRPRSQSN